MCYLLWSVGGGSRRRWSEDGDRGGGGGRVDMKLAQVIGAYAMWTGGCLVVVTHNVENERSGRMPPAAPSLENVNTMCVYTSIFSMHAPLPFEREAEGLVAYFC